MQYIIISHHKTIAVNGFQSVNFSGASSFELWVALLPSCYPQLPEVFVLSKANFLHR